MLLGTEPRSHLEWMVVPGGISPLDEIEMLLGADPRSPDCPLPDGDTKGYITHG